MSNKQHLREPSFTNHLLNDIVIKTLLMSLHEFLNLIFANLYRLQFLVISQHLKRTANLCEIAI